jgi:hypothetical protein
MAAECWAAPLGECSRESSEEHVISQTIFADGLLEVRGLPWLKREVQQIPKKVLTSGILCKAHNEQLSPVDAVAGSSRGSYVTSLTGRTRGRPPWTAGCSNVGA